MEHRLTELRAQYREELKKLYSTEEADTIFFWLMEEQGGGKRIELLLRPDSRLNEGLASQMQYFLTRLTDGVPVQQLLGYSYFMGRRYLVDASVLIPRPETEELCAWIVDQHENSREGQRIMDVGTGTGCIAISLALEIKKSNVKAMDVSADAVKLARRNAATLNANVSFMEADILEWESIFPEEQRYDVIVSNPPYITEAEKQEMHPNVLQYEPHLALFVEGKAPLLFYDYIADFAKAHLSDRGCLYFEINRNYGEEIRELLIKKGFHSVELKKDMHGADRMIGAHI